MSSGDPKETESSKLMKQYMEESRRAEDILAGIAESQYKRYEDVYKPLENFYINAAGTDQTDREHMTGLASADVVQQASGSMKGALSSLGASGAAPGSGKAAMMMGRGAIDTASALSGATNKASLDTDLLEYQRLQRLVDIGRGQGEQAAMGLTSLAAGGPSAEAAYKGDALSRKYASDLSNNRLSAALGNAGGIGFSYLTR